MWAWKKTKTHALARWIFTAVSAVCLYKCKANEREKERKERKNNQRTRVTSIQMLWFNSSTNRTGCPIEIDKENEQWSGLLNWILLRLLVACALECWSACSSLLNLPLPTLALMRQHSWRTRKKMSSLTLIEKVIDSMHYWHIVLLKSMWRVACFLRVETRREIYRCSGFAHVDGLASRRFEWLSFTSTRDVLAHVH